VNLGGGFGIPHFPGEQTLDIEKVGVALGEGLAGRAAILRDTLFAIELGRWLVGEAGVYLTRIVDRKISHGKTFLITDGGMQHQLAASGNFGQVVRRNYPAAIASGFGIPHFHGEQPLDIECVSAALSTTLAARPAILRGSQFAIELGRWIVGEAGVYLTRIVDRKISHGKTFLVTDGGMQHQLAASGNFGQVVRRNYPVAIASRFGAAPDEEVSIVGCLCTPLDRLADDVMMARSEVGDLVAVFLAGAYGLSASPQAFLAQQPAGEMAVGGGG
ncbi:MAG TPA: hypothetical protein VES64_10350, partial [Allosphingosinicella sp.]|nr:hypothetical protein [Allosphingosinicella sp.]